MGKLNYTHRKISGLKLGTTVKKDVLKHSQAAGKSRLAKDPHLEVNLFKKALCDDGLAAVCEGLCEALLSGNLRLDELHLAKNQITLTGLRNLGKVVRLAYRDLKDLDLRGNKLEITTVEDERIWAGFLESFRDVCSLRRLDISENPIGDRGVEILWRVYSREPAILLPKAQRSNSLRSDTSEDDSDTDGEAVFDDMDMDSIYEQVRNIGNSGNELSVSTANTTPIKPDTDNRPSVSPTSPGHVQGGTELHGLRGIPYIVVSDIGAGDSSALFLSYILPIHPTPERLMPYMTPPKLGCQADTLQNYYSLNCRGIVYNPNEKLSSLSQRVLESAEAIREGKAAKLIAEADVTPFRSRNRRNSDGGAASPLATRIRRDSNAFFLAGHAPTSSILELDRARCKIQGTMLKENGVCCVSLWSAAFKMLIISRTILFDPSSGPYEGNTRSLPRRLSCLSSGPLSGSIITPHSHGHAKHTSPPESPTRLVSFSEDVSSINGCILETPPMKCNKVSHVEILELSHTSTEYGSSAKDTLLTSSKGAEIVERKLPGGLPEDLWKQIIVMTADPDGLLSSRQSSNVIDWAKTRDTLNKERGLAGKLKSLQIWRILEATGCLTYESN